MTDGADLGIALRHEDVPSDELLPPSITASALHAGDVAEAGADDAGDDQAARDSA